jgi:hypothetical protein
MSTGFCNLRSLRKALEYLEHGGHVCGWHGKYFMAVVVLDELVLEVPGPWWRSMPSSNPGVAMLVVLEIFFALADELLISPATDTKVIAVKVICPLLVILAVEGLGV